jgi:cholesterol oxidase
MPDDSGELFDAIVIGSGFGGAVVACRLAEDGACVLVLERGQPYPPGSFARTPHEMRGNFWDPDRELFGLFDISSFTRLDVVAASGLGGGSLIYANVMLRKDERTFVREDVLDGGYEDWPITRGDLEPHYDSVEKRQRPVPYPIGRPPFDATPKTLAMMSAANELGMPVRLPKLAVRFAGDDGEVEVGAPITDSPPNLHEARRTTCRLVAECDLGCNYGAKNSLDFTYLSDAKHAGAQLRTCCEARTIAPVPGGGWSVTYVQHVGARGAHREDLLDPTREVRRTVRARRVVLAAGAVGSPRLLLSNRASLPGMSEQLGRRVSANGDTISWIRDATRLRRDGGREPRYLDPSRGPVITASIDFPADRSPSGREFHIQDAGAPALGEWMWQGLGLPGAVWLMRRRLVRAVIAHLRGRRRTRMGEVLSELLGTTAVSAAMMPVLAMGRDVPDGRYRLRDGELELDWSSEPSDAYYDGVHDGFRRLARALGGHAMANPLERLAKNITVHPVGGCPMGVDARRGVVDSRGRVFGYEGLYVADGSALPGPVGPNPSFTIAAFADRVADCIVAERSGAGASERPVGGAA